MTRLALMVLLSLVAGLAAADTFELADPAADMLKEPEVQTGSEPVLRPPMDNVLCTVDTTTGACSCIDTEKARKLTMTREECVDRVMQSLKIQEP
jgi:hypothetical protein